MRRWNGFFDMMQYPIKILFIAFVFVGIGSLPHNSAITAIIPITQDWLLTIFYLLRYIGSFIITNFPLLIVIKMVGRRRDSSTPIFAAILGYLIFIIVTTFVAPQTLGSEFYTAILGIRVNLSEFSVFSSTTMYPFQMGVFAAILVVFVTRITYRISRKHSVSSVFGSIDKETYCIILTIIICFFVAFGMAYIWPYFISLIQFIMGEISKDITNPTNLFNYGIFERLMSLFGLNSISQNAFWFGSYGGSWMNSAGTNFIGDVSIWTAQQSQLIVSNGAGRLITPHYLLNMFAIPAVSLVIWLSHTNKKERFRYLGFMIISIIISILFGSLLPFELFLLISAPFLLLVHLLTTGLLYGVLQSIGVFVGYNHSGSVNYANPGGLFNLLPYFNDTYTRSNFYMFIIVGGILFVLYFLVSYLYFNFLALDFINFGRRDIVDKLIESFGGLGNLRNIHASYDKVTVTVINPNATYFKELMNSGVGKIVENKDGYNIYFGSDSLMIRKAVLKKLRGEKEK